MKPIRKTNTILDQFEAVVGMNVVQALHSQTDLGAFRLAFAEALVKYHEHRKRIELDALMADLARYKQLLAKVRGHIGDDNYNNIIAL